MAHGRYFVRSSNGAKIVIRVFLVLLLLFSVAYFIFRLMKYNDIMETKREKEEQVRELSEKIDKLEYLIDAPIDDEYKIRLAREKLGMCFPDEIIFHTDFN